MGELSDKTAVSVACGSGFTMTGTKDGLLYLWGRNDHGQLGFVDNRDVRRVMDG